MATVELAEIRTMPPAILAAQNQTAFGALSTMRGFGLSAPENVFIIEVDDHQMSWFLGLTTIAQTAANPGAFAASVLMQRLHRSGLPNPPLASPPSKYLLDTKLVGRTGTRDR